MTTFPDDADAVTPEWLSAPRHDLRGVQVLDQRSGTTGRLRLGLDSADGPDSVFVKLPPFEESQRQLVAATDMGRREARFYAGPAVRSPAAGAGLLVRRGR